MIENITVLPLELLAMIFGHLSTCSQTIAALPRVCSVFAAAAAAVTIEVGPYRPFHTGSYCCYRIYSIDLDGMALPAANIKRLIGSALTAADFSGCPLFDDAAVACLAACRRLTRLDCSCTAVTTLAPLVASNLETLVADDLRLHALCRIAVGTLSLVNTTVCDSPIKSTDAIHHAVRSLDIADSDVTAVGGGLVSLGLSNCPLVTDETVDGLSEGLRQLDLAHCSVVCPALPASLTVLCVNGTDVGQSFFEAIASLPNLRVLSAKDTNVGAAGMVALAGADLLFLAVGPDQSIDDNAIAHFGRKNMAYLDVSGTAITVAALGFVAEMDLSHFYAYDCGFMTGGSHEPLENAWWGFAIDR